MTIVKYKHLFTNIFSLSSRDEEWCGARWKKTDPEMDFKAEKGDDEWALQG